MSIPQFLYSFHSPSEAEEILTHRKVRLKTAIELGDPFEFKITDIAKDWIAKQIRKEKYTSFRCFKEAFRTHVPGSYPFYGLSAAAAEMLWAEIKRARTLDRKYSIMCEVIQRANNYAMPDPKQQFLEYDNQLDRVGILRLFERVGDSRLWSKYAGSDGVAIAFAVDPNSTLADPAHCLPVRYTDTIPRFTGKPIETIPAPPLNDGTPTVRQIALGDETLRAALSSKDIAHGHEREWRFVRPQAGYVNLRGSLSQVGSAV